MHYSCIVMFAYCKPTGFIEDFDNILHSLYVRLDLIYWMSFIFVIKSTFQCICAPLTLWWWLKHLCCSGWYAVSAFHDYVGLKNKWSFIQILYLLVFLKLVLMSLFLFREQLRCCWTRTSIPASWRTMYAHQGAPPSTPCTSWRVVASAASWSMQWRLHAFGHGETVTPVNNNHTSTPFPRPGFWTLFLWLLLVGPNIPQQLELSWCCGLF